MTALAEALNDQALSCESLGSPFTARLLRLVAARLAPGRPVADRLLGWPGDLSSRGQSVPLRLAGGLHALVLSGRDAGLARLYGRLNAGPDAAGDEALWQAIEAALVTHEAFLQDWLNLPPQTNEVRRSGVLIAGAGWLTARLGLPIVLSELGASAGLNLIFDRYALEAGGTRIAPADPVLTLAPDWRGAPLAGIPPRIAARRGVDLNPLDPDADRLRLMSYIWADQSDRLARTGTALAEAQRLRPAIDRGDAAKWLEDRLAQTHPGQLHLVTHTIAWQYFPEETKARARAALAAAGARATPQEPLAHLGMEANGERPGAGVALRIWPPLPNLPDAGIVLARADFHGRWIDWRAPG